MTRRRRTEIVARASQDFARKLAQDIQATYPIKVIQSPQPGLVMIKQRESGRNGLFYLGELYVTEAKVALGESLGLGLIQDDDADRAADHALNAAVIDAAFNAGVPELAGWLPRFEEQARLIAQAAANDTARINQSKVSFETMDA